MAILEFDIELEGEIRTLEALAGVSKHANFAQKSALRAAGKKGRSTVAKILAAKHRVPMKLFRKRVRYFAGTTKTTGPIAAARLWLGAGKPLGTSEHADVLKAVKLKYPKGFQPKLASGHVGWFYRAKPTRRVGAKARTRPKERHSLPIRKHVIDIGQGAEGLMKGTAREMMKTVYPDTFRKDYKRRINKLRAKYLTTIK